MLTKAQSGGRPFDEGLVAFSDSYQVKTFPQLPTPPNLPGQLLTFNGRKPNGRLVVVTNAACEGLNLQTLFV